MVDPVAAADTSVSQPSERKYSVHAIHALRTVQNNTLHLSRMADQKASILMGATLLVFSVTLGRSLSGTLPWAFWVLAGFAFLSSLCAVMAVMPSIGAPPKGSEGAQNKLFFGHFHTRDEKEWADDVLSDLTTDEDVFRLMLRDIFQNGVVLQKRKFRYLSYAYRLLLVGLVVTLTAFAVELALTY
ncbi:MAG: Pycsar system effector family protein [Croceibacterium sp.]